MSTGYTHKVCDGEQTELKDFAFTCAHAFIRTKNENMNDELVPINYNVQYYIEKIQELEEEAKILENMSMDEWDLHQKKTLEENYESSVRYYRKCVQENDNIHRMITKVLNWPVPSKFDDLKKFMLEQLNTSLHNMRYVPVPEKKTPICFADYIEQTSQDIYDQLIDSRHELRKYEESYEKCLDWCNSLNELLNNS